MVVRLTTGKAVRPLRPPNISTVRDLSMPEAGSHAFPELGATALRFDEPVENFPIALSADPIIELDLQEFQHPRILRLPASMLDNWEALANGQRGIESLSISPSPAISNGDVPILPRSYQSRTRAGRLVAENRPTVLHHLQPILEPSLFLLDGPSPAFPHTLSPSEIEAVRALLIHDEQLLLQPPGTGKRTAVCLAISNLFQRGELESVLILSTEANVRVWAEALARWAPGLMVTAVHGERQQRRLDWNTDAHVYLADYETVQTDLDRGALAEEDPVFDLIVLDMVLAVLHWATHPFGAIRRIEAQRKWALAGGQPRKNYEWQAIFGILRSDALPAGEELSQSELRSRLDRYITEVRPEDLQRHLPGETRERIWLDLSTEHRSDYESALAEERHTLGGPPDSVAREGYVQSYDRLQQSMAFYSDLFGSMKVRALVDLIEEIAGSDEKSVVFIGGGESSFESLRPALKRLQAMRLDPKADETVRRSTLDRFRDSEEARALFIDLDDPMGIGGIPEASYIVHFDHGWNAVNRVNVEREIHPVGSVRIPRFRYEFWTANTIDENLFRVLYDGQALPEQISGRGNLSEMTIELPSKIWREQVFDVTATRAEPVESGEKKKVTTGLLPGTTTLRTRLDSLSPEKLREGAEMFISGLGFLQMSFETEIDGEGGEIVAWSEDAGVIERVLVRYLQRDKNIGIAEGRSLLEAVEGRNDVLGAYLIVTTDFTNACRKLADESEGKLGLIAGSEFYRQLHVQGWFK